MYILKELKKIYNKTDIVKNVSIILIAMSTLDIFNIPSYFVEKFSWGNLQLLIWIVVFVVMYTNILKVVKFKVVNYIDMYIMVIFIGTLLYTCFNILSFSRLKIQCITLLYSATFVAIVLRIIILRKANQKQTKDNDKINVYDLKDLYEGNIETKKGELIFIEERDVSYDLLNRGRIISELYNSINFCRNKRKFVISLIGEWGSGKTTILNIVKEQLDKEKFIVIDKFEIQTYNNDKSLIFAIIDEILKETGIKFKTLKIKKIVDSCVLKLSAKTDMDLGIVFLDDQELEKLKIILKNYLEKNNKRVVFIIDNFERTSENNVLITLKAISTILDLDRFIFVLSYDEKEMKDIFENKLRLNYDYMDKIVQLPLYIPSISRADIDRISTQCLKNLFKYYGIDENELKREEIAVRFYNEKIKDLRLLKRNINSICNICLYDNDYLNRMDNLLIEVINQQNPELYVKIRENAKYYISENQTDLRGYKTQSADEFNSETTSYFDKLFSDEGNKKYLDIMSVLFPYVEKYKKSKIKGNHGENVIFRDTSNKNYKANYKSLAQRRIHNGRFFELYFTKQQNGYIYIDNEIKKFIKCNNEIEYNTENEKDILALNKKLVDVLFLYTGIEQKYIIETLEIHINEIEKNKLPLVMCLINLQEQVNNTILFLNFNAKDRLKIVCAELIKKLTEEELYKLTEKIEMDYKNMYFIRGILYWLNPTNSSILSDKDKKIFEIISKGYEKLIENVFERNINIYDDLNYSRYNIYCLIEDNRCKNQMNFINKRTVFEFLADMINEKVGTTGYGYYIGLEEFNKLTTHEFIDSILEKVDKTKMNSIEKFIEDVYQKSKETTNKEDISIYRDEYIKIEKSSLEGENSDKIFMR